MVFEVDLDGNVVHVKSLDKPESSRKKDESRPESSSAVQGATNTDEHSRNKGVAVEDVTAEQISIETGDTLTAEGGITEDQASVSAPLATSQDDEPWPEHFDNTLKPYLSDLVLAKVKALVLEGPEPPLVSDSGWGGRQAKQVAPAEDEDASTSQGRSVEENISTINTERGRRGRDRGGRGRRGGRGGRGGVQSSWREDNRKVLSDVCNTAIYPFLYESDVCDNSPSHRRVHVLHFTRSSESCSMGSLRLKPISLLPLMMRALGLS